MLKSLWVTTVLACVVLGAAAGSASDRIAVYGKIDRVILEPTAEAPVTAQIWGVFSVAVGDNPTDYQPAARGYLYYQASDLDTSRVEWADLKRVAGTGQIVAFGSRWEAVPRLRPADQTPSKPDGYTTNAGIVRITGRTDYAPVRAIVDFKP